MDRKNVQKNQSALHQIKSASIASNKQIQMQEASALRTKPSPASKPTFASLTNNPVTNFSYYSSSAAPHKNNINNNNNQIASAGTAKNQEGSSAITAAALCCGDIDHQKQFRLRSIKSKYDESEISDKYVFLDVYPCVECQMPIDLYSICRNFKDMNKDLEWALCANCHTKILPKLRIKYLEKKEGFSSGYNNNDNNTNKNYYNNYESHTPVFSMRRDSSSSLNSDHYNCDESEVLYSPFHLKYNFYNSSFIESRLRLDIDYLKIKFNAIFWNSIWYFKIKDLPYDFISPYKEPLAERVKLASITNYNNNLNMNINNPNHNINVNEFNVNGSNNNNSNCNTNKTPFGINNRVDSIQNLITGRNLTAANTSSSASFNKNITMSNNNFLNSNLNATATATANTNFVNNNPSSVGGSKNVQFEDDEQECIIVNNETNYYLHQKNYSVKDITNNLAVNDDKSNKGNLVF